MNKDLIIGIVIGVIATYLIIGICLGVKFMYIYLSHTDAIKKYTRSQLDRVGTLFILTCMFIWPKFV